MREAIALIMVILMGAFAATQAQGASLPKTDNQLQSAITNRVIAYIDDNHNASGDWMQEISALVTAWKSNQDNPLVASSLEKIVNHLMELQENKEKGRTPTYKTL